MLGFWDAGVRQADRANHNPPAASSAAIARDKRFAFIVFVLIPASHSLSLRHYARFPRVDFRFGTKAGNSGAKHPRAGMNLIPIGGDYTI
jgi:hypothetical protein